MSRFFYLTEMQQPMINKIYHDPKYGLHKISVISEDFDCDIETLKEANHTISKMTNGFSNIISETDFNPVFFPSLITEELLISESEEEDETSFDGLNLLVHARITVSDFITNNIVMTSKVCAHPGIVREMEGRNEFVVVQ